jgi:hypothetical protein
MRVLGLAGVLATGFASSAWADGYKSFHVCGGNTFATCAAVQISVVGQNVTVRVWNLSGNSAATYGTNTYAGTVFVGIGFYNVPAGAGSASQFAVSGPAFNNTNPGQWTLSNQTLNGFTFYRNSTPGGTAGNGIVSGCAAPGQLPAVNLYSNNCTPDLSSNWVTFSFKISGTWDPSTAELQLRGLNGPNGARTECVTGPTANPIANCTTVTPEPVTMSLLATGLAGMGGAGLIRRRRKQQQDA